MSRFTVALDEVLDRMKTEEGITRQLFASRIEMPMSTFASYANGRTPDPEALGKIAGGLHPIDAVQIIKAHLYDQTPKGWHERIADVAASPSVIRLDESGLLPAGFRADLELLIAEGLHNDELIQFIRDTVQLLHLSRTAERPCPPKTTPENFRIHTTPAKAASIENPSTPTTPKLEVAEEDPSRTRRAGVPRAKRTAGIRNMSQKSEPKIN